MNIFQKSCFNQSSRTKSSKVYQPLKLRCAKFFQGYTKKNLNLLADTLKSPRFKGGGYTPDISKAFSLFVGLLRGLGKIPATEI